MNGETENPHARSRALAALADSGRELSTAMILFHTNLANRVGLGVSEEKILELVQRHQPISAGELATHAEMAKNSLSDTLDRLQAKGFVERRPDPSDGRKVSVVTAPAGVARIEALFSGLMSALDELNDDYSSDELALIADYQARAARVQATEALALADGTRTPT